MRVLFLRVPRLSLHLLEVGMRTAIPVGATGRQHFIVIRTSDSTATSPHLQLAWLKSVSHGRDGIEGEMQGVNTNAAI